MIPTSLCIPLDIVEKILLKLPVESILRFRSVCKTWYHLSKTSPFAALHLTQTEYQRIERISFNQKYAKLSENGQLIFGDAFISTNHRLFKLGEQSHKDSGRKYYFSKFNLVSNSNGILCITDNSDIVLINPSLNEIKKIPTPPEEFRHSYSFGLGFDPLTNNLKVVVIPPYWREERRTQVYSLSTNSWRKVGQPPRQIWSVNDSSVFLNGVIHWCAHNNDSGRQMLTFNTTTELFQLMNLPKEDRVPANPSLLVLNQEFLAFVSTESNSRFGKNQCVNIWVMKEYGVEESWIKLYSIGPLRNIIEPVSFWEEGKLLLRTKGEELVLYDMPQDRASGSIDLVGNLPWGYPKGQGYSLGFRVCKESLISFSSM